VWEEDVYCQHDFQVQGCSVAAAAAVVCQHVVEEEQVEGAIDQDSSSEYPTYAMPHSKQ
jgi:hypothetical protein